MFKKIIIAFVLSLSILFTTNVNAAFYNVVNDGLSVGGGLSYDCQYDGTDNDCPTSKAYGVAPNTTSALFNVRQSVYPQYHTSSDQYTYDNFKVNIYSQISASRAPVQLGGVSYGPFLAGNGTEVSGVPFAYSFEVDGQLDFVTLTLCVSKTIDWEIDNFYIPNAYYTISMIGGYYLTNAAGQYTFAGGDDETYYQDCFLKVDDDNDGVTDLVLSGVKYQVIYSTTGYEFNNAAQNATSVRAFMTFKNNGTTPFYVSYIGLGSRLTTNRFTSADESVYLKVQQKYLGDLLLDFWQSEVIDQQELRDLIIDNTNPSFPNFLNQWNSKLITNSNITAILNLPLTIYNKFKLSINGTCSNYTIPFGIFNSNYTLVLPCKSLSDIVGVGIATTVDTVLSAFILLQFFKFVIKWWSNFVSLRDSLDFFLYDEQYMEERTL